MSSFYSHAFLSASAGTMASIPATLAGTVAGLTTCFAMQALGGDDAVTQLAGYTIGTLSTGLAMKKITSIVKDEIGHLRDCYPDAIMMKPYYLGALFPPAILVAYLA